MRKRIRSASDQPFFRHDDVLVIAHRGGSALWPENTLHAFERAVRMGANALETDIRGTKDGQIVLIHDRTVDRTTNGSGPVRQLTLTELRGLCASHNWSPHGEARHFPLRGKDIRIPTLAEAFAAFPDTRMHIDIKERNPAIIRPFCQMIREYGKSEQVLVASFHADILKAFRRICPEVATSASKPEIRLFYGLSQVRLGAFYSPHVGAIQVPDSVGRIRIVTRRFADTAHKHGMKVYVWTVNQIGDMRRLLNLGVDGIITDFPDRLLMSLKRQI